MALINFRKIITELSDDGFNDLKKATKELIPYYYLEESEVDRLSFLEKIGEYLRHFELNNRKVRDNDIATIYIAELGSLMKNRIKPGSSADKYSQRFLQLEKEAPSADGDFLLSLLEDITKIFVCFYDSFARNQGMVFDITFFALDAKMIELKDLFLKDKPEPGKDKKAFMQKIDGIVPGQVKNAANEISEKAKDITELTQKFVRKPDTVFEPVHDVIEMDEIVDRYSKRALSFIMLAVLYCRITDFESGKVD